ncbi:MAG: hypothetical protein OQL19_04035 [Gammaproteobacteria bacterium]|nr:hypothetical protein [Gammaproteobacteria bacterium]
MTVSAEYGPGTDLVFLKLETVNKATLFATRKAWFKVGKDLKATANREILKKPRQGRLYILRYAGGRKRRHRASRPGEYHANMTGALRRSMQWKVKGFDLNFGYGVANKKAPKYAPWVEKGTKRMAARPSLKNAIDANMKNAEQHTLASVLAEFK